MSKLVRSKPAPRSTCPRPDIASSKVTLSPGWTTRVGSRLLSHLWWIRCASITWSVMAWVRFELVARLVAAQPPDCGHQRQARLLDPDRGRARPGASVGRLRGDEDLEKRQLVLVVEAALGEVVNVHLCIGFDEVNDG